MPFYYFRQVSTIETDRINVTLRSDGIVHVHIKDRVTIDLDCQSEMKRVYWEATAVLRPFIFTSGEFLSLTREAQKNAKNMENDVPVAASALVVHNVAQKLMADFYYKFDRPKHPLKVFKDFNKGIEWLKNSSSFKELEKSNQ